MKDIANEYLQNAVMWEKRIEELKEQAACTSSLEVRRKLRKRINALYVMVNEARQTAYYLEHYYDKPEENTVYVPTKSKHGKSRKKFSRHGYGSPTPAAVMRSKKPNRAPVSGIRAALSRGNATKRDRSGV